MIKRILITNPAGDTLNLNLRSSLDDHGLLIFNLTGLGSPKATVSGLSGPTYDGITGEFVRTDARHLLLTLAIPGRGDAEETAKQTVYDFFPVKEEIIFNVTTDIKDAYVTAIVESVEMNQFSKVENAVISLYCPNPYFLDMIEPLEYAWYGSSGKTIEYDGDLPTGIFITVHFGEKNGTYMILTNDHGSQSMTIDFSPLSLGSVEEGDTIYIDTRFGQKSVIHENYYGAQQNLMPGVGPTEDWIELRPGDNNIAITLDELGGLDPNMPDPADLQAYLPLNETNEARGKAVELHNDEHFSEIGSAGANLNAVVYSTARRLNPVPGTYFDSGWPEVDVGFNPIFDFTFVFWGKIMFGSTIRTIISAMDAGTDGYYIEIPGTNIIGFYVKSGGVNPIGVTIDPVDNNAWSCYFCWFDESTETIYGQRNDLTPTNKPNTPAPDVYQSAVTIGGKSSGQYLNGNLQAIALYLVVLTSGERDWVYNGGYGRTYAELSGTLEITVEYRPLYQGV